MWAKRDFSNVGSPLSESPRKRRPAVLRRTHSSNSCRKIGTGAMVAGADERITIFLATEPGPYAVWVVLLFPLPQRRIFLIADDNCPGGELAGRSGRPKSRWNKRRPV